MARPFLTDATKRAVSRRRLARRCALLLVVFFGAALLAAAIPLVGPPGGGGYHGGGYRGRGPDAGGCAVLLAGLSLFAFLRFFGMANPSASWDSRSEPAPRRHAKPDLDAIRRLDPEFSAVLFQDFVSALHARAHHARSNPEALAALAPYLSKRARNVLERFPLPGASETAPTLAVILDAIHVEQVTVPSHKSAGTNVWVVLRIESRITLGDAGSEQSFYVRETWALARNVTVRTKPPEAVRSFHCPNCDAPFTTSGGDRCELCGEVVSGGRFDWTVTTIRDVSA